MPHSNRIIIPGPPGTGKTYTLINKYIHDELFIKKTKPENILVTSFGNAAVKELRERIEAVFPNKNIQVKTLHSFGVQETKLDTTNNLLKGSLWNKFKKFEKIAGDWSFSQQIDNEGNVSYRDDRPNVLNYAKAKRITISDAVAELGKTEIDVSECETVAKSLNNFKEATGMFEFSDMILKFVEKKEWFSTLDVLFLDEAQDLNPLQWEMVNKIEQQCSRSYIAGDDDQSIYAFQSASPKHFIKLEGEERPLIQSRRVPQEIHDVAMNILSNIKTRREKQWLPKDGKGSVQRSINLYEYDFKEEEWLILVRNNYLTKKIKSFLEYEGIFYESSFKTKNDILSKDQLKSIRIWERLNNGAQVSDTEVKLLWKTVIRFETYKHVERGFSDTKQFDDKESYNMEDLKKDHGLIYSGTYQGLALPKPTLEYLKRIKEVDDIQKPPRVRISSIHNAKGTESENVILYLDMAAKTKRGALLSDDTQDTELRCWFVAVTRSAKNLFYLRQDQNNKHFFNLENYI